MDIYRFLEKGRPRWEGLEKLLVHIENRGFKSLEVEEARLFGVLYRRTSSDLLMAQSKTANVELLAYLNDLVARSYAQIYTGHRLRIGRIGRFYWVTFPRLFRANYRYVALAMTIFLAGGISGFTAVTVDPAAGYHFLPAEHLHKDPVKRVQRIEESGHIMSSRDSSMFSAFLFTHNLQVAFLCFALGLTLGIGTVVFLFYNGIVIGSVAALYHAKSVSLFFWAWILPHGVLELFSIFLAGGAGLLLARGLIKPGELSRADSLRAHGRTAVMLILGMIPVLVVAGIIEGTLSQIHEPHLPYVLKLVFSALLAVGLGLYLALAGRRSSPPG